MASFTEYIADCTCPTAPLNGYTTSCTDTDPVGSSVYYYCNSGYVRIGNSYSTCRTGGYWTNPKPICQKGEYTRSYYFIVGLAQFDRAFLVLH